jgi:2-polyprenyl-3-methyl-5-hydroxy-6-metoxy-1,4-benzoquinol methylase
MQRVCEPELMDDASQARAYAEADFSVSDAAFTNRILELLSERQRGEAAAHGRRADAVGPAAGSRAGSGAEAAVGASAGSVAGSAAGSLTSNGDAAVITSQDATPLTLRMLDLGCGPGNISFRLARACPHATVLGLDGSEPMLAIAMERLRAEPALEGRLSFRSGRLPSAELEALGGGFDLLVSNSLLHHLADPQALWGALAGLAAPGAWLVLRDLRRPDSPAAVAELVERHAASASPQLQHDFEASLRAAFRLEEVGEQLRVGGLSALRLAERDDRYLDVWGALDGADPAP